MRAWRLLDRGTPPVLQEVPVPRPTGEQVLLRVEAAGLCHSDLHLMDGAAGAVPFAPPYTLGHEVVGTAVATGSDAGEVSGRFAVHGIWACGSCRQCRRGRENYCTALTRSIGCGIGRDGGLADYMLVPSPRHLVPVGDGDPVALAPLTDAALTAFHAISPHRDALAEALVVVIGVGGLGHLALQLLHDTGTTALVAVDPRPEARDLAAELGATHVAGSAEAAIATLATLDGGAGADLVLDFVGSPDTLGATDLLLAPGGSSVVVGSGGGSLTVAKGGTLARGWTVSAPFWGTRADLVEVVALSRAGRVHAETETYALADAMTAYERLRAGQVRGRAVVVPGAPPTHTDTRRT
ncbi:NAD(P)-dependent alcohol dehydrogenase [Nocardioides eburneiflavus]|uniref:alcohol dehydrogenase n=2 Tax=Nocardioides eburneiflavus TaxID=2518372 RepID=A0A4Z1CPU7_9ACTN|nr:NAD(P)-dependent alcohol dehydrogenase [Nocardioides eburneiflavus]